jgi:hypothetical protein
MSTTQESQGALPSAVITLRVMILHHAERDDYTGRTAQFALTGVGEFTIIDSTGPSDISLSPEGPGSDVA